MSDCQPIPEIPLRMAPESATAKVLVEGGYGFEPGDGNKLGGTPDWLQGDETPDCPECDEPMEFYSQLDHLGGVEALKDCGMIYVFLCRECYITDAVLPFS